MHCSRIWPVGVGCWPFVWMDQNGQNLKKPRTPGFIPNYGMAVPLRKNYPVMPAIVAFTQQALN